MDVTSPEYLLAIWNIFNIGRVGNAMVGIGSILAIWLAFRVAVATRNSEETNLFAKIMSSAFGLIVVMGTWVQWSEAVAYYVNTAAAFVNAKDAGAEISPAAEGFIEYVGTTEVPGTPTPLGIAFLVVVLIMIMAQIWYPKQK